MYLGKRTLKHNPRGPAIKFTYIDKEGINVTIEEYYIFGKTYKNRPRFIEYKNGIKTYEIIDTDYDTIRKDYTT